MKKVGIATLLLSLILTSVGLYLYIDATYNENTLEGQLLQFVDSEKLSKQISLGMGCVIAGVTCFILSLIILKTNLLSKSVAVES